VHNVLEFGMACHGRFRVFVAVFTGAWRISLPAFARTPEI
jgi:hypothetical protein